MGVGGQFSNREIFQQFSISLKFEEGILILPPPALPATMPLTTTAAATVVVVYRS